MKNVKRSLSVIVLIKIHYDIINTSLFVFLSLFYKRQFYLQRKRKIDFRFRAKTSRFHNDLFELTFFFFRLVL